MLALAFAFASAGAEAPEVADDEMNGPPVGKWQSLAQIGFDAQAFVPRMDAIRDHVRGDVLGLSAQAPPVPPARRMGTLEAAEFTLEKIEFDSAPGFPVTAHVYVPKNRPGPMPAVLNLHGHWPGGKRSPQVRTRCAQMARMGIVAMAIDGYGVPGEGNERGHLGGVEANPEFKDGLPGYLLATGVSLAAISVRDARAAISLLAARPEVDPARIALVGGSWGATQAILTTIVDDRPCGVAGVLFGSTFTRFPNDSSDELIAGVLRDARREELLALPAPRPMLLIQHFVAPPYIHEKIAAIYAARDAADRFEYREILGRHDFQRPYREVVYRWLSKRLLGKDEPVEENPNYPFAPDDLFCHADHRVGPEALSVDDLIAAIEAGPRRRSPGRFFGLLSSDEERRMFLAQGLRYDREAAYDEGAIDVRVAPWTPGELPAALPAIADGGGAALYRPAEPGGEAVLVLASGADDAWALDRLRNELAAGRAVCVVRVDGIELRYHRGKRDWDFDGLTDAQFRYGANVISILYGRPHYARKIGAIRRAARVLREAAGVETVRFEAEGNSANLLILAAALDEDIAGPLVLTDPLLSYKRVGREFYPPIEITPPDVLLHADVPDLLAACAPRPVTIRGGHLADGVPLSRDEIERRLDPAADAYPWYAGGRLVIEGLP